MCNQIQCVCGKPTYKELQAEIKSKDDALTFAIAEGEAYAEQAEKLQAELDKEKKERSDLYIEYTILRDRFGECFEYNQNCIDEIARLKELLPKRLGERQ
jgi:hypothetical protein